MSSLREADRATWRPPESEVPEALLDVRELDAGYGAIRVVRGLSLHVRGGEIVALFGPNGAGKSTTLLTVAGELEAQGGEVRWRGKPLGRSALHRRAQAGLILVPEEKSVIRGLTVRENLLLGAGGIEPAIELFPELRKLLDRPAGLLSGGEQQMLVVGRALAMRPAALLVDELSLGLAPVVVDRLLQALRRAADDVGVGVLLVEQQARRALSIADRWYVMKRGRLVASGDRDSDAAALEAAYLGPVVTGADGPTHRR